MPINPKVLVTAVSLGGSCIGIPLCFWGTQNTEGTSSSPNALNVVAEATSTSRSSAPEERKSISKGVCTTIPFPTNLEGFLEEVKKEQKDYVGVTCSNTDVKDDYIPLPKDWTGLFSQLVLSGDLASGTGKKFEMYTETQQVESNTGSSIKAIFRGTGLKSDVEGTWTYIDSKQPLTETLVSVLIKEGEAKGNLIYLFLPKN